MSLEIAKLEKARELPGGGVQARCPACAEGGHDRSGEHLRIYPDGRFGCCVHPKDGDHRKRIFALVGHKGLGPAAGKVTLRIKVLAHGHHSALPAARSVKAALVMPLQPSPGLRPPSPVPTGEGLGTLGTGKSESVAPTAPVAAGVESEFAEFGTLGTPKVKLCARARVDSPTTNIDTPYFLEGLKDLETVVPSVPREKPPATAEQLPFLTAGGDLSIPFDSPERYHWWKLDGERLTIAEIRQEVRVRLATAGRGI